jgi:hypothetical protein
MQFRDANHNTQRGEILALLIKARGGRVPLPEILACSAQYGARIYELRKLGFRILNERERVNGQLHTWFRLISGPTTPSNQEFLQQKSETGDSLFGDLSRDRTYLE